MCSRCCSVVTHFSAPCCSSLVSRVFQHLICMIREAEHRCESIFLHVLASNSSAIKMYRSVGFVTAEHLPGHYHFHGVDHDALLLVKYINTKRSIYEDIEADTRGWCAIM
jgi:hypothetical protein